MQINSSPKKGPEAALTQHKSNPLVSCLMDASDIFCFFLLGGGGRGSPRRRERGGDRFFVGNPRGGGVSRGRGAGRVSTAKWRILGGGGLNIFFGAEMSTKVAISRISFKKLEAIRLRFCGVLCNFRSRDFIVKGNRCDCDF